ncbi:MAG: hypothetical protein ABEH38_08855 [Flavobacteriales bacterium]
MDSGKAPRFLILPLFFLCTGCVTLFRGAVQNDIHVSTKKEDPSTRIVLPHTEDSGSGRVEVDLERKKGAYKIRLKKEGYKAKERAIVTGHVRNPPATPIL